MMILRVLLFSFGLVLVCGVTEVPPQPPSNSTIKPTTTTPAITTTSTTPKPTTTTKLTTTSKITTTSKPTPPPTTPSTTVKPTPKPAPTPKPGPTPDPSPSTWSVNYAGTNRTCIVALVAVQIEVPMGNTSLKINLPTTAHPSGNCSQNDKEVLALNWDNGNMIQFDFDKTNTSKFELEKMSFALNLTFPKKNASIYNFEHNKCEFSAPLENSYKCTKLQTFNLTGLTDPTSMAYLHISHVQLQAFRNTTGTQFNSAIDCEGSPSPDVVPIVVGCVLAGLVLMILVGYLLGRRRCQARGYLSM